MRLFRLMLAAAALTLLSHPLHADTTYTYTGNPFTLGFPGPTAPFIQGSFTVASPIAANTDVSFAPLSFSFSVGSFTLDSNTPGITLPFYDDLTTDSAGNIVNWLISLSVDNGSSPSPNIFTINEGCCVSDSADDGTNYLGSNDNTPGTWAISSTTPEPSSIALLATGLLTAVTTIRRRT